MVKVKIVKICSLIRDTVQSRDFSTKRRGGFDEKDSNFEPCSKNSPVRGSPLCFMWLLSLAVQSRFFDQLAHTI